MNTNVNKTSVAATTADTVYVSEFFGPYADILRQAVKEGRVEDFKTMTEALTVRLIVDLKFRSSREGHILLTKEYVISALKAAEQYFHVLLEDTE